MMHSICLLAATLPLAAGKIHWTDELGRWLHGNATDPWVLFGFTAQAVFMARFVVQWIESERRGVSYVPTIFWYLSLAGTALLLIYAVHRGDPVFILGQFLSSFIYIRNLMLVYRPRNRAAPLPVQPSDGAED